MYGAKSRNLTGRQPVLTLDKSINEPTERFGLPANAMRIDMFVYLLCAWCASCFG